MAISKFCNQSPRGCAHTPLQANGFLGRLHQCLWHHCDHSEEIPKCVFCGASLQSPVENCFILLSSIFFFLSLAFHWFFQTYIMDILVGVIPNILLLTVLYVAASWLLQFLLVRIASACICAGARWKEIAVPSHREDAFRAMFDRKDKASRDGLQRAWLQGLFVMLSIHLQVPIGFLALIDTAVSLIRRLLSREYRHLWIWFATLAFSALAFVVELFLGNIFITNLLKCVAVLVIAIILVVNNCLDMN